MEFCEDGGITPLPFFKRNRVSSFQVNLGKLCNQACLHCHVEAGPGRTEIMTWDTMSQILRLVCENGISAVDITGGAPELNPNFRTFVVALRERGCKIIVRCNLTVLFEKGMEGLPEFYKDNDIHLIASLPCYTEETADRQRGKGIFAQSIRAIQCLNSFGYGKELILDLVYNPSGAFLPSSQEILEKQYKERLFAEWRIEFSRLLAITNVPIGRFAQQLKLTGRYEQYLQLLRQAYNPLTVGHLMCRNQLSIDWDGNVYDCDFNAMEQKSLIYDDQILTVWNLGLGTDLNLPVVISDYCLACTAGEGSSCAGSLIDSSLEKRGP